jgi:hypothetical protein
VAAGPLHGNNAPIESPSAEGDQKPPLAPGRGDESRSLELSEEAADNDGIGVAPASMYSLVSGSPGLDASSVGE